MQKLATRVNFQLRIISKKLIANNVLEFELEKTNKSDDTSWNPGAYIGIDLPGFGTRRYSLIPGAINKDNFRVAIRIENTPGSSSSFLSKQYDLGDSLDCVEFGNNFELVQANSYFFLAGGIGITPFIGMIAEAERKSIAWELVYLGRSPGDMPYLDELVKMYPTNVSIYAKSMGKIFNVASIEKLSGQPEIYCCGPQRLIDEVETINSSISRSMIHTEQFFPKNLDTFSKNQSFTVFCKKSDVNLRVEADETIFMVADFEGIELNGDCMEGTCGACVTRVVSGEIEHRDTVLSLEEKQVGDRMMICVSRAKGKSIVIDL